MQQSRQSAADLVSPSPGAGLHMRTRCLPNSGCTQMGPHAVLADRTVRESIMTGVHFLGCQCKSCQCGTYDRHNQVTQVALAYLRYELKFTGSTSSVQSLDLR
jgi:hypothetical protein